MKIIVVYATAEGQTRKIAEFAADCLRGRDHAVELVDATENLTRLDLAAFDGAVLAACVRAGRHHPAMISFARAHAHQLEGLETAFLSVSMTAAGHAEEDLERLARYEIDFIHATGWQPDRYHDVAGARLYLKHNALGRWILGLVDHHRYDTSKDHEFTNWRDLRAFIDDWASRIERDTVLGMPLGTYRQTHPTPTPIAH